MGGPDSPFGLGIGGVQGSEDPTKATGKSGGALSRGITFAAQARRMLLPGWMRGPLDAMFGGSAEEREGVEAGEANTGAKLSHQDQLKLEAAKAIGRFGSRQSLAEEKAAGARFGQETSEYTRARRSQMGFLDAGIAPDMARQMAENASQQRLLGGQSASAQGRLGAVQSEREKLAAASAQTPGDEGLYRPQIEASIEREKQLKREILGITQQEYELSIKQTETALNGVRQRMALEKTAYQGRKADAQHFSELDPFQQARLAELGKRVKGGDQLNLFERRQFQGLGGAGMDEFKHDFDRQREELGRNRMEELGIGPRRSGSDVAAETRFHEERAITPELRNEAIAVGGRVTTDLSGKVDFVVDYDSKALGKLERMFSEVAGPYLQDIVKSVEDLTSDAMKNAVTKEQVTKMINAAAAGKNNQGRIGAGG